MEEGTLTCGGNRVASVDTRDDYPSVSKLVHRGFCTDTKLEVGEMCHGVGV